MAVLQMKLEKLATSQRVLKNASAILYRIVTSDERNQPIHESLKKAEGIVKELDDELLTKLYKNIFPASLSGSPQRQIAIDGYFAFLERLGTLLEDATSHANEAYIAIREAIGYESIIGAWDGRK
jgi:hypothetical protein